MTTRSCGGPCRYKRHAPSFEPAWLTDDFYDDGSGEPVHGAFYVRLFNMLLRYETLFVQDQGTQGALPPPVFQLLQSQYGVEHECYASPLNVSYTSNPFNSLFEDTDCFFGSQGSFFSSLPRTGCFEVNPPFDKTSVQATYRHIAAVIANAAATAESGDQAAGGTPGAAVAAGRGRPLLFVVVAPRSVDAYHHDPTVRPESVLAKVKLEPHTHVFTKGFQHRNTDWWICPNPTWITFVRSTPAPSCSRAGLCSAS
jgi:hypothetical protein